MRRFRFSLITALAVAVTLAGPELPAVAEPGADTPAWAVTEDGQGFLEDYAVAVAVAPSGYVHVVGTKRRATGSRPYVQLSSYTPAGTVRWTRSFASAGRADATAQDVAVHPELATVYVLLTQYDTDGGRYAPVVAAYDARGRLRWQTALEQPDGTVSGGQRLALDPVAGRLYVLALAVSDGADGYISTSALDLDGHRQWETTIGRDTDGSNLPRGLAVDPVRGVVVVTGTTGRNEGTVTAAYDPTGSPLWRRTEPGTRLAAVTDAALDPTAGTTYITGYTPSVSTPSAVVTIAYGPDGARLWVRQDAAPATGGNLDSVLVADPVTGGVVVASTPALSATGATVAVATRAYAPNGRPRWRTTVDEPVAPGGGTLPLAIDVDPVRRTVHVAVNLPGGAGPDVYGLLGYDPFGQLLRQERFASGQDTAVDELADLAVDPASGNVYLTGSTELTGEVDDASDWLTLAYPPA